MTFRILRASCRASFSRPPPESPVDWMNSVDWGCVARVFPGCAAVPPSEETRAGSVQFGANRQSGCVRPGAPQPPRPSSGGAFSESVAQQIGRRAPSLAGPDTAMRSGMWAAATDHETPLPAPGAPSTAADEFMPRRFAARPSGSLMRDLAIRLRSIG